MRSRRRRFVGILVAAVLSLTSHGLSVPATAAESPEAAVNALLDAVSEGDLAQLDTLVCEAERETVREMFDIGAQLGLPPTDASLPPLTFDISDRSVELVDDDGELATVRVSGTLSVEVDQDRSRDIVRAILEADLGPDDPPVSDADLDIMLPLISSALAIGQALDEELSLVLQDGEWIVCGGLGDAAEDPDELPAVVSFEGLCGLVSVDQLSSLSELDYDSSSGFETSCTYSLSSYADYHTATISLYEGNDLEDLQDLFGLDEETTVSGNAAFWGDDQLFVQVDDDVLQVAVFLAEEPVPGFDLLSHASQIAELFIPVLPQLQSDETAVLETPEPEGPSLCESLSLEAINALGPPQYDTVEGSEGYCSYTTNATEGGFAFLSTSLDASITLEDLRTFVPDGEALTIAGRPAYALMGQLFVELDEGVLTVAAVSVSADGSEIGDPETYAISVAEALIAALAADAG